MFDNKQVRENNHQWIRGRAYLQHQRTGFNTFRGKLNKPIRESIKCFCCFRGIRNQWVKSICWFRGFNSFKNKFRDLINKKQNQGQIFPKNYQRKLFKLNQRNNNPFAQRNPNYHGDRVIRDQKRIIIKYISEVYRFRERKNKSKN